MRARPASPAAPAPSPSSAGYHSSGAPRQSEFTAWSHCFHLSLGCPFQVLSYGHGQAAWGLLLAGVVCSGSSICYQWIFFHLEESPGDRRVTGGWWQGQSQSQQCRAAGDTQPWLREGTASASSSFESLQGPPWHWGSVPPVPPGCSGPLPCSSSS